MVYLKSRSDYIMQLLNFSKITLKNFEAIEKRSSKMKYVKIFRITIP